MSHDPPPRFRFARASGRGPHRHGALLRALAYRTVETDLAEVGFVARLGAIDAAALAHWRHAWRPAFRPDAPAAHWRWDVLRTRLRNDPYRFEVAIWGRRNTTRPGRAPGGDELCGLALGVLSNRRRVVRVQYLARTPVPGAPLKGVVATAAAAAAQFYGRVWGGAEVRFEDPLPGTEIVYRALGCELVRPPSGKAYFVISL